MLFPTNSTVFSVSSLLLIFGTSAPAEDLFPDKGLESAVREAVFAKRYNEEPLTKDDVKNISEVRGKGKSIKSLAGLENCVAVQLIDLENNEIEDVSPCSGLELLQSINLAGNQIESIEPLAALKRVQYLELSRNKIKDIAPLEKMSNMRSLYLSENQIEQVDVLRKMPKAWTLYLRKNPVKELAPVGEMKWLSSLDLSECNLSDLGFLKALTELKSLHLNHNQIKDLAVLVDMASGDTERRFSPFWRIYLKGNPLSPEAADQQIAKLQELGARISLD